MHLTAALLAGLYGLATILGGLAAVRSNKIQTWAAGGMLLAGGALLLSMLLLLWRETAAPWVALGALALMQALAINNGLRLHGRITPSHHAVRLATAAVILTLAFWGMG